MSNSVWATTPTDSRRLVRSTVNYAQMLYSVCEKLLRMCPANDKSFKIKVFGVVQGVGFRAYVRHEARSLGLKGYVKNLDDGSVEILAIGPLEALESLIARIRGAKPPIRVTSLKVEEEEPKQVYTDFIILR